MKLQSIIPVTYNDTKSTSKTVIMTGEILETYRNHSNDSTEVVYKYVDADGVEYGRDKYIMTAEESDAVFLVIKSKLPAISTSYSNFNDLALHEGFKIKMAERFPDLSTTDIEIVL